MNKKKLQIWLPLIFSLVLIGGMYFGFRLRENTPAANGFFSKDRKTSMQEVLDLVKMRYVDPVNPDTLQAKALNEIMSELDPHSVYIPARNLQEVNEDMAGKFEGIGVEFNIFYDTVHVLHVIAQGPSDKAGLQVGDRIIKVNGQDITGSRITTDEVKKLMRGPRGTQVDVTISRNGQTKTVSITRGTIPLPSLDAAYLLDSNTGYIKLNKFSETTYEEFMLALEGLKKKNIQKLILDLRGNGGGLMNEAVDIADEFLSDDKLIVYTEGKNVNRREYRCKRPGLFEEGELAVLVDEISASASEVLAGALQDWDRAVIVGRRTFGKGLVQEQYMLSDGSAIRLTVARYYTPVGRSIQRSYEKGKKVYMEELIDRYNNGEMVHPDSIKAVQGKYYETKLKKRKVYGGGGILPDVFVPIDTGKLEKNTLLLFANGALNKFMYYYYLQHREEISRYKSAADFVARFTIPEDAWKELTNFAARDTIQLNNISAADKTYILKRIKAQLARFQWRSEGYFEVLNSFDAGIKQALKELSKTSKP